MEEPADGLNSQEPNRFKSTLLTSPEGRILLIGVTLAFAYIFWLGVKLLLSPEEFQVLIGMTAMDIMFGRAAAMAFGYSLYIGHAKVIPVCMILETILVLIVYPLFVFSWRHLLVLKGLKRVFESIRKSAEAHKDKVQRYGVIGLFAFVWFPFWMTGPVVGCVIGFLLGLRPWLNMTVVLSGTYLAILAWALALFLRRFHDSVAAYSSQAAMVLMVLLIVVIIAGTLLHKTLHENKNRE
ncbi:MAG: small multi-drug export protein [Planctomycetota bacterium]